MTQHFSFLDCANATWAVSNVISCFFLKIYCYIDQLCWLAVIICAALMTESFFSLVLRYVYFTHRGEYVSSYLAYILHTILHSKYGMHASSSFPHWIPDCWYKPFVRLLCDTSVQFGFAIIAHLLYHCAKDRRGVLALHSLSYTWGHNGVKAFIWLYDSRGFATQEFRCKLSRLHIMKKWTTLCCLVSALGLTFKDRTCHLVFHMPYSYEL